jgi:hypothetical protein
MIEEFQIPFPSPSFAFKGAETGEETVVDWSLMPSLNKVLQEDFPTALVNDQVSTICFHASQNRVDEVDLEEGLEDERRGCGAEDVNNDAIDSVLILTLMLGRVQ